MESLRKKMSKQARTLASKKGESFEQKRAFFAKKRKLEESVQDLLGISIETAIFYSPSTEQVLLTYIYEMMLPLAHRTGKNVILIPNTLDAKTKRLIKKTEDVGLIVKEVETNSLGVVTVSFLEKHLSLRTLCCFFPWVDPITGAIYPVSDLAALCREGDVYTFVDASLSAGKIFFQMKHMQIDMLMFSINDMSAYVIKNKAAMMRQKESFVHNSDLLSFLEESKELVNAMDRSSYLFADIKAMMVEKLESFGCRCLNTGSTCISDRVCFVVPDATAENICYYLKTENIDALQSTALERHSITLVIDPSEEKDMVLEKMDVIESCIEKARRVYAGI